MYFPDSGVYAPSALCMYTPLVWTVFYFYIFMSRIFSQHCRNPSCVMKSRTFVLVLAHSGFLRNWHYGTSYNGLCVSDYSPATHWVFLLFFLFKSIILCLVYNYFCNRLFGENKLTLHLCFFSFKMWYLPFHICKFSTKRLCRHRVGFSVKSVIYFVLQETL